MVALDNKVDTGRQWIFGLVFVFILCIMAVIMIPVVDDMVKPALISASTLTGPELDLYEFQVNKVMFFMKMTPFILLFVVVVFMILSVVRKESNQFVV